ncbi:MAG: hypothetical protein WBG37_08745, partial [Desulfobacterales bacterium]
GPAYILPGNHDPWGPGSVWEHPAWAAAENLTVLVNPEPVPIAHGILLPCPLSAKYGRVDPTVWITPESGAGHAAGIRIGLAHGNVEGLPGADPDFPIARDAAQRGALDYLALGHWHSLASFTQGDDPVRMAYCGTPEATRFGERESGKALLVEISEPGAAPRITALETGHYIWEQIEAEIHQPQDLSAIAETIDTLSAPERTLLDLRLRGLLFARQQADLGQLLERVAARFFFSRVDRTQLLPAPDDPGWIEDLPAGILREAARQLISQAQLSKTSEDNSPDSPAALALQELYAAVQEARS